MTEYEKKSRSKYKRRDYKSDKDLSAGETVASEAAHDDEKLGAVLCATERVGSHQRSVTEAAHDDEKLGAVLCATERVGSHQLSVTEAAATPKGSSDAEEGRAEMHAEEATLQTQDLVLQKTLQEQWDECKEAMKMFPYFDTWDDDDVRECCVLSKIKRYEPDQIILGNCKGKQNSVYFILKGQCQMIQHMELATRKINGRKYFRLLSKDFPLRPNEQLEFHFMQVCLMNEGECFDVGENLEDRSIVTTTEVECLLCPYHLLLQNSKANIWEKIKHFLDIYLPSKEQLFKEFLKQRRWFKYREGLIEDILKKKSNSQSNTTIHDVPYSIRIKEGVKLNSK